MKSRHRDFTPQHVATRVMGDEKLRTDTRTRRLCHCPIRRPVVSNNTKSRLRWLGALPVLQPTPAREADTSMQQTAYGPEIVAALMHVYEEAKRQHSHA